MSLSFNGSSDYLRYASGIITAEPLTLACWAYPDSTGSERNLVSLGNNGTKGFWRVAMFADDTVVAQKQDDSGSNANSATSGTISSGAWQHFAAVFASDTSRISYLNGTASTTETTNISDPTPDFTSIGALERASVIQYFDGDICEAAAWNVALSSAEIAILSDGYAPFMVRPDALVGYWPLVRNLEDPYGGFTMSATGTTVAAHYNIKYKFRKNFYDVAAAAPAGNTPALTLLGVG